MGNKRNKKKNYNYERESWLKFVKFANCGKVHAKNKVLIDKQPLNPFNATIDDIANFFHLIFDMSHHHYEKFTAYLRVFDHYLPNLELGKYTCQLTVHHETFLTQRPATCFINKDLLSKRPELRNREFGFAAARTWNCLSEYLEDWDQDVFLSSPDLIARFIYDNLKIRLDDGQEMFLPYYSFHETNMDRILKDLDSFLKHPVSNHEAMLRLMDTAIALDNCTLTNKMAMDLYPEHHFVKMRLEASEEEFWSCDFVEQVIMDVKKKYIPLNIAAKELGVTPSMLFATMMTNLDFDDEIPSFDIYVKMNLDEDCFWENPKVKEVLENLIHREIAVDEAAASLGVSRKRVLENCGPIKTVEELETLKKEQLLEKKNKTKAPAAKATNILDEQIRLLEEDEEELCDYELTRLKNLRERKAILEMLNMDEDKQSISVKKEDVKMEPEITSKFKLNGVWHEGVPMREKSQRIQKKVEKERLRLSTDNAFNRKGGSMGSPTWFGATVPYSPEEDKMFKSTPVPKFDLHVNQLLELTRDYRDSVKFLDSLVDESKLKVIKEEKYNVDADAVDWKEFTFKEEKIVSTASVSCIDSFGDMVTFGTAAGRVGVLLAGRCLTLVPHSDYVTSVLMSGNGTFMSTSKDGTARLTDLSHQSVGLEYSWDMTSSRRHGVLSIARLGERSFIADCGRSLVNVDIRSRNTKVINESNFLAGTCNVPINVEPQYQNLFSVVRGNCVKIFDKRNPKHEALEYSSWACKGNIQFANWSSGGKYFGINYTRELEMELLLTKAGFPKVRGNSPNFDNAKGTVSRNGEPLLGNVFCPWQETQIFSANCGSVRSNPTIKMLTVHDMFSTAPRFVMNACLNSTRSIIHCHSTRPIIILANASGAGRLSLLSSRPIE